MNTKVNLVGLARAVVDAGLLDESKAVEAVQQSRRNSTPLVTWLVQNRLAPARRLMELAAEQFGVAFLDLSSINPDVFAKDSVTEKLARQHRILPLYKRGNKLYIAMSDPANQQAVNDVQFSTGFSVEGLLVEDDKLGQAIDRLYDSPVAALEGLDDMELDGLDVEHADEGGEPAVALDPSDEAPVVRFINKVLLDRKSVV